MVIEKAVVQLRLLSHQLDVQLNHDCELFEQLEALLSGKLLGNGLYSGVPAADSPLAPDPNFDIGNMLF